MSEPIALDPASPAVAMRGVGKTYRLYSKPIYRVLDLLGLCPATAQAYTEHDALRDVTLTIGRGEKVAIIGRNGAGKSTLLKLITGTLRPTHGTVSVNGVVSALLQIGTGFHPDFTGRQNVHSSFAHLGIVGRRADELFDDVIDFAELQGFIDQPMKTYSTGMTARLMFAAATVLEPEILVIDELLGVGDSYFAHKSYERMRQMCSARGTTLLLVTHDIYTAASLCDRFIWIDRGRVQLDGDARLVREAYEGSIKAQEEDRLRRRNASAAALPTSGALHVRVGSRSGFALPEPLALASLALIAEDGTRHALDVVGGSPEWSLLAEGNLGPPTEVAGRACRTLEPRGSIFHKAEWLTTPAFAGALPRSLEVTLAYGGAVPAEFAVTDSAGTVLLRRVVEGDGRVATDATPASWRTIRFDREQAGANAEITEAGGQYGTGLVRVDRVEFRDSSGKPVVHVPHGGSLRIQIDVRIDPALPSRDVTLVIGFNRSGSAIGGYVHRERLSLPSGPTATVGVTLDPLLLGSGPWLVTVAFGEAGLFARPGLPFFTLNPAWHHFLARRYELVVESTDPIDPPAFVVLPATVEVAVGTMAAPRTPRTVAGPMVRGPISPRALLDGDPIDAAGAAARSMPSDPLGRWRREHQAIVEVIEDASREVVALLESADLSSLTRHQHALIGFDWKAYLSASSYRIQQLARLLMSLAPSGPGAESTQSLGTLLDSGSYFGNFSLAMHRLGWDVIASDTYGSYAGALDPWRRLLERNGVQVVDPGDFDQGVALPEESADVVFSGGVIEHIPHTPKGYLLELRRLVRRGGLVVIETPNHSYAMKRALMADGKSVYAPLEAQFESEPPFAGHHREYTMEELRWMLGRVGLPPVAEATMDYSYLALGELTPALATEILARRRDPSAQELLMIAGRRES